MRLLELGSKATKVFLFYLYISNSAADEVCEWGVYTNYNIIICSQQSLDGVNKILLEQYELMVGELTSSMQSKAAIAQKSWFVYREELCGSMYDAPNLGAEAPIDKLGCLQRVTTARLSEVMSVRSRAVVDSFYRAVDVILTNSPMPYEAAIQLLSNGPDGGEEWATYAKSHCEITVEMKIERTDRCMARMRYQIPDH